MRTKQLHGKSRQPPGDFDPCPFCATVEDLEVLQDVSATYGTVWQRVYCPRCDTWGPRVLDSPEAARQAWNRRPEPTPGRRAYDEIVRLLNRERATTDRLRELLAEALAYIDKRGPLPGLFEGDGLAWFALVERLKVEITKR
jgi:hypothetical protein